MKQLMSRAACVAILLLVATQAWGQNALPPKEAGAADARQLQFGNKPWTGDFDKMLERRIMYYVSYKLTQDAQANGANLRQNVAPSKN